MHADEVCVWSCHSQHQSMKLTRSFCPQGHWWNSQLCPSWSLSFCPAAQQCPAGRALSALTAAQVPSWGLLTGHLQAYVISISASSHHLHKSFSCACQLQAGPMAQTHTPHLMLWRTGAGMKRRHAEALYAFPLQGAPRLRDQA